MSIPSPRPAAVRRACLVVAAILSLGSFAAPAVFATGSTIRITDGLDPVELRIRPGTTVTFRNDDGQRHRLRSRAGARFDTGNIEPGEARSIQFTVTGRYPYVDERDRDATPYHGTIVVTASGGAGRVRGKHIGGHGGRGRGPGRRRSRQRDDPLRRPSVLAVVDHGACRRDHHVPQRR